MFNTSVIAEALLMSLALSADSFAVALSYGINKIRISKLSIIIISAICTFMFAGAAVAANLTSQILPQDLTKYISFGILFILGIVKLFQNSGKQGFKTLTLKESVLLGFSMALDGLAAGVGAGTGTKPDGIILTLGILFILSLITTELGNKLGFILSNKLKLNISKLGAVMLIILAFLKL